MHNPSPLPTQHNQSSDMPDTISSALYFGKSYTSSLITSDSVVWFDKPIQTQYNPLTKTSNQKSSGGFK